MLIRWEDLVEEVEEEREPVQYYSTTGKGGQTTLAQGFTTGIE